MDSNSPDWTSKEKKSLANLRKPIPPPARLKQDTISDLREHRLLVPKPTFVDVWLPRGAKLAMAVTVFFLGVGFGKLDFGATSTGKQFALLVHEDETSGKSETRLALEYATWVGGLALQGRFTAGTKFLDSGRVVRNVAGKPTTGAIASDSRYGTIGGFFLISADSYQEAVEIAQSCPHVSYNGSIEVREIDAM